MPWPLDEFLQKRVEQGRALLAESAEHRGDADLQHFISGADAFVNLHKLFLTDGGHELRPRLNNFQRQQGLLLFLSNTLHMHSSAVAAALKLDGRCIPELSKTAVGLTSHPLSDLRFMGDLGMAALCLGAMAGNAEVLQQCLAASTRRVADWGATSAAAAALEQRQVAAGFTTRLSASELLRLLCLLHRFAVQQAMRGQPAGVQLSGQMMASHEQALHRLLQLSDRDPQYLQEQAAELSAKREMRAAAVVYERTLQACETRKASVLDAMASMGLANTLIFGGRGPTFDLAEVDALLARCERQLALIRPWAPGPAYHSLWSELQQDQQNLIDYVGRHRRHRGVLPVLSTQTTTFQQGPLDQRQVLRTCSGCGERASQLRKCGGCKQVEFCSLECQKRHWKAGHKRECAQMAAGAGSSA